MDDDNKAILLSDDAKLCKQLCIPVVPHFSVQIFTRIGSAYFTLVFFISLDRGFPEFSGIRKYCIVSNLVWQAHGANL